MSTPAPESIRTVEVEPPSRADEGFAVFLAAGFVVLCVIYIVAFEVYDVPAARQDRGLLPFQTLFADLPPEEQRIFRQMQEGFDEALVEHERDGEWPGVERLARSGVPPFVRDPLDQARTRWERRSEDPVTIYLGVPTAPWTFPSYLIRIQPPDPQAIERLNARTALDEEHRALPDGTLLHVTYWRRDRAPDGDVGMQDPARAGWVQIRRRSLFEEAGGAR